VSPPRTEPPAILAELAPGWSVSLAYQLIPEVTTWRLDGIDGRVRYAKVDTVGRYPSLGGEQERLVWASAYLPVPAVVHLVEREEISVLITEGLPGRDATDAVWRHDLPGLVTALGRGLAAFHNAISEEWCPFRFTAEGGLEHVRRRVADGVVKADDFHQEHGDLTSAAAALTRLEAIAPNREDLVVCHGDYCPPNALLTDGRVTGFVDLGQLGVADRWRDVAIGGWSAAWNFGPEYEAVFYRGYGISPDPERIAFYRLLWELTS
jgi:kanamycin kinase